MRVTILSHLAWRELRAALRGRTFLVGAGAFGILAITVAQLGMAGAAQWGVSALDRTAAALLNLVLLFVPLLALPLGTTSFAGEAEDGTLPYLVAQPVTRGEVYCGKALGLLVSMSLSLLVGFGMAALWLGVRGGIPTAAFAALVAGAWLLGIVCTTLGIALAVACRTRVRALAAVVAAWLVLVFLCDFGVLALAAAQTMGPSALLVLSVANPVQAAKTLSALAITERLEILGPAGVHAVRELGRVGLTALLCAGLFLWTALAAGSGFALFRRRNLS